jgi:hypothetical protein
MVREWALHAEGVQTSTVEDRIRDPGEDVQRVDPDSDRCVAAAYVSTYPGDPRAP